jgi:6-pyruvoyltetrahydropterin/6-carboxytetrahydropterin synthase
MGSYRVTVEATFSASHQLRLYDGSLEPLHGHQWRVQASFAGRQLDQIDVLVDFVKIERRLDDILAAFDNRHLNDLPCFDQTNPSAENVARSIFETFRETMPELDLLERITVWEAPNCSASYGEET